MIFVDTSAFLAIENRQDAHHKKAVNFRDAWKHIEGTLVQREIIIDKENGEVCVG